MNKKTLVVIDIQSEYISSGRPFCIETINGSLQNARVMLNYARKEKWNIIHVRHLQEGSIFNKDSEYVNYIDGFSPLAGEFEVEKSQYSCFSAQAFENIVRETGESEFVVIGYGTSMCCLATIIEGFHRGYKFSIVQDATRALADKNISEESMHTHAIAILARFSRVTDLRQEVGEYRC